MGRPARADGLTLHVEMDRWTAFVVTAHLRLRLDIYYRRILQDRVMPDIKRPMELAGLKSRLVRAQKTEAAIGETGKRFDKVLDQIDELHSTAKTHAGDLEIYKTDLAGTISRMIGGSNGGDPLDGSAGQESAGVKPADPVKPAAEPKDDAAPGAAAQTVAAAEVAPAPAAVAEALTEPRASWQGQ